ncbi:hypothetical protein ACKLNO_09585 [Neisseriaceae bacterium B1]
MRIRNTEGARSATGQHPRYGYRPAGQRVYPRSYPIHHNVGTGFGNRYARPMHNHPSWNHR